jgi:hypothetical protein
MERLQGAFKAKGIHFRIDPDAQAILRLGLETTTTFALYLDEITADEMLTVLQQLSTEDRKPESKRRALARFESLSVEVMSQEGQQKLSRVLGAFPVHLEPSIAEGQGTPPSGSGQPAVKVSDRQALLLTYNPDRARPVSEELKRFVNSRHEHRAGTVQVFLVLRSTKS